MAVDEAGTVAGLFLGVQIPQAKLLVITMAEFTWELRFNARPVGYKQDSVMQF